MSFISVIIAGGKGERFWPLSTPENPKQFISMFSDNSKSMLNETVERLSVLSKGREYIVTTENLIDKSKNEGFDEDKILAEPFGKNTAMAVALSVFTLEKKYPDSIIGIFPADHVIRDKDKFLKRVEQGIELAEKDNTVIFGINPTRAETGYGYIEIGNEISQNAFKVKMFREKPDEKTAKQYIETGNFFWNSGMFIFKLKNMKHAFYKYAKELNRSLELLEKYSEDFDKEVLKQAYNSAPSIPFDIAIMERIENAVCLVGDFLWDDVGSWTAMRRMFESDDNKNIKIGNVKTLNVENSIIVSKNKKAIVMGLKDVIIVESEDGILITSTKEIGKIKEILKQK